MAMKDFDFKAFMLQKGERVGLWVAGGLAVLLVILFLFLPGGGIFSIGKAGATAEELKKTAQQKSNLLNTAQPSATELAKLMEIDPGLMKKASSPQLDPDDARVLDVFWGSAMVGNKRRNPVVLGPEEFVAAAIPAQIRSYIFIKEGDKPGRVAILKPTSRGKNFDPKGGTIKLLERLLGSKGRAGGGNLPPGMPGPGGMMGAAGGAGGIPPGGGGVGVFAGEKQEYELKYITLEELKDQREGELAETVLPTRMAIITGAFPYKAQLEEFQRALRLKALSQVMQESVTDKGKNDKSINRPGFSFLGVNLQRRTIAPDGKPSGWVKLDISSSNSPYVGLVINVGQRYEPEQDKLRSLVVDGLVMKKPVQVVGAAYPNLEDSLGKLKETLQTLEAKKVTPVVAPSSPFDAETVNVFGPSESTPSLPSPAEGNPYGGMRFPAGFPVPPGMGGPAGGGTGETPGGTGSAEEWAPPAYCLFRIFDVTIEPGNVYEYQVQVKMMNPNYGKTKEVAYPALAAERELLSDWIDVKRPNGAMWRIRVPDEFLYYAVDEKQLNRRDYRGMNWQLNPRSEQTVVQAHRWMAFFRPNELTYLPVGDWVIGERLFVARGEYLGQRVPLKVPVWAPEENGFVLATRPGVHPRDRRMPRTVDVSFGAEENQSPLLVDFEGGPSHSLVHKRVSSKEGERATVTTIQEEAPAELLLLAPDGRLLAKSSSQDEKDKDRTDRHKAWADRIKKIEEGNKKAAPMFQFFMGGMGGDEPGGGDFIP